MIARTWRGSVRAADAERYVEYLERTGFAAFRSTSGNLGALGLRRRSGGRTEFLLLSLWDSEEAIRRFAGQRPEQAVFFPEDDAFLVERDEHVDHFEVVYVDGSAGREARGDGEESGRLGWLGELWAVLREGLRGDDGPAARVRVKGGVLVRMP